MRRVAALIGRLLARGSVTRNVLTLAGGTGLGQSVALLAAPLLTRLYTPEDFGVLGVYGSILGILVGLASLRYDLAIPLPKDDETAAHLLIVAVFLVVVTSGAVGSAVWVVREPVSRWLDAPALAPLLWVMPAGLLGAGVYQALTYWSIRQKAFAQIARTRVGQGLAQTVSAVAIGVVSSGPAGLLLGDVFGRATGSGTLASLALPRLRSTLRGLRWNTLVTAAILYRRFPLISSVSTLLNSLGLQVGTLFLAAMYGPKVAGWYALTQRVIGVPMTLVGSAVSQVYLAEASRLMTEEPRAARRLFADTARWLLLAGGLPILAGGLLAPWVFPWLFGESWRAAGTVAQLLALMFATQFVVAPLSLTLTILQRQETQLLWDAGRLVLICGCFLLSWILDLSPLAAVWLYGASMAVAYTCLLLISYLVLKRFTRLAEGRPPC